MRSPCFCGRDLREPVHIGRIQEVRPGVRRQRPSRLRERRRRGFGVPVSTTVGGLDDAQMMVMQDKIQEVEGAIPGESLSWDSDEIPPEIADQFATFV